LMPVRFSPLPSVLFLALGALAPSACLQLREDALSVDGDDASVDGGANRGDTGQAPTPDVAKDMAPPTGDTATPPPDVTPTECTPHEVSCTADERSVRTCNDQGRWMVTSTCSADTACSAGVCLCARACADEPGLTTQAPGFVDDFVGGGNLLYLAVNGPQASIRRFDLSTKKETVVKNGEPDVTVFGLDSDVMGNLIWCSDISTGSGTGTTHTGQLVYGTQRLESGPCAHVRRRDNFVYFMGDLLYRKTLDASAPRQTVTTEPMDTFEIAGDHLYFVDELAQEAVLKRLSLADPTKVDIILRRPDAKFLRVMPDASHVYLVSDGQILRVPQAANAQAEVFWQDSGPDAWALAQTNSHVYWTTTTASGSAACSETQVLRRPKAGGPVTVLSRTTGYCAGQLARIGDLLYTPAWVSPPSTTPTKILRIRL
jgi:hypothetical protein